MDKIWFDRLKRRHLLDFLPDKAYVSLYYRAYVGKKLNLKNPRTFNEKLQWLKLYYRDERQTVMVDKCEVKKYVASVIGEEYIVPTIGVYGSADEIDFSSLPEQFVLKCNHNSGKGLFICENKSALSDADIASAKERLTAGLKEDYYLSGREWPYKNVKRKIIAEKYLTDEKTSELRDYKFFCFNGKVKAAFIASDRQNRNSETKFDFFDEKGRHLDVRNGHPNSDTVPELPENFELMKRLAAKLSTDIPHVRVDFYEANGKVYFGEMTFFHWSGFIPFEPEVWDYTFGSWLELPEKKSADI